MMEEVLFGVECPHATPNRGDGRNTLFGKYDVIYILKNKKMAVGTIGVKIRGLKIIAVDVWFKEGYTNFDFVKRNINNHKGWYCMVTCMHDDPCTRLFINYFDFEKKLDGDRMRLYSKEL